MNTQMKFLNHKLLRAYRRFMSVHAECKGKPRWIEPKGYETNVRLYNLLTKSKVPLILKNKDILTWYMCGPTVYDSAHIGHAVTYVKSDIIRRILSDYFNINVVMVMCITDIDDKIINQANAKGQPFQELTRHYEMEFFEDMRKLNVKKPDLCARVSEYMPEIIKLISRLVERNDTYVTKSGSVYFDTVKYYNYGKLYMPEIEPLSDMYTERKSSSDFCLWKTAKEGEPFWESPWGKGRPGWHTECSAIASAAFGNCIDIHSGGIDLVFPHHENEEAQSCCYHNVDQWVNYWLHCGHLSLKGDAKMSKSLKNTISIQEYLEEYTANQFRVLCLLSHYKNAVEYNDEIMQHAIGTLHKIEHFINDCENYVAGSLTTGNVDEVALLRCLDETKQEVHTALADNFNTAHAMKSLNQLISVGSKMLRESETSSGRSVTAIAAVTNYLSDTFKKLGVTRSAEAETNKVNIIEDFVQFRSVVRSRAMDQKPKDKVLLTACDEARSKLSTHGITLKDTKDTTTWSIQKY